MSFKVTNIQETLSKAPLVQKAQVASEQNQVARAQLHGDELIEKDRIAKEEVLIIKETENLAIEDGAEEQKQRDPGRGRDEEPEEEPEESKSKTIGPDGEGSLIDIEA